MQSVGLLEKGKVTVGIPTRDRASLVVRAAESVLAQSYRNIELVISDNASSDDTVARLSSIGDPRLRLIRQAKNIGMIGNFNACLEAAQGEFFQMVSDDDLLEPTCVEKLVAPLLQGHAPVGRDEIGLTWCRCAIVNPSASAVWYTQGGPVSEDSGAFLEELFNGNRGPRFCGVMIRTKDAWDAGCYDGERYGALCDTANWAKVALRYENVICIEEPLARFTLHAGSSSSNSVAADWQRWGKIMGDDLIELARSKGRTDLVRRLSKAEPNLISNLIVTVTLGKPGWLMYLVRECFRAPRYMFSFFVARRAFLDGWKFLKYEMKQVSGRATRHHLKGAQ